MEPAAYREMAELEDRHWWFIGRRRIISALLGRLPLPADARILEIGCGSGGNLAMLRNYGAVSAGEYDEQSRRNALDRGITDRIAPCHLPNEFPFGDEKFDLVALFDVLEHIEDDSAALKAIRSHVTDNGWLVMTVPAFPFLWSNHDVYNHHHRRYRSEELMKKLRDAGFEPAYRSYFNFWLFPLIALVRLMSRLYPSRKNGDLSMPGRLINQALAALFASERVAVGRFMLPFGVSYIISARPQ